MIKHFFLSVTAFLLMFSTSQKAFSQNSEIYRYDEKEFYKALELYEKEKYGAAKEFFSVFLDNQENSKSELIAEARYYRAVSAMELFHLDSEFLVYEFVMKNPESSLVNNAWFRLADYMYKKKDYPRTIKYYNMVDRFYLDKDELSQLYFQKGYSYYIRNDYENGRVNFYEIKDIESKYSSPALYYYSHIAYSQENYETALQGFLKLKDDESFSGIAPYYISQIYYLQKNFEKVIEFAVPIMDSVTEKRSGEMAKIIGESYFYLENYKEALPYLLKYQDDAGKVSIEDKYQLAYAYYMTGDYEKSAGLFERISLNNSEISQSALYHLADCYLKAGQKDKARNAFSSAARMDFNPEIKEDALFNYAKVTYELSYTPFNEAVRAFNTYITQYPASRRTDEAYNFLVLAYMNTKNYRMALEALEKIRNKDRDIQKAYQKVSFFRALELYTNQRFTDAITVFDKSLQNGEYDRLIKARTLYWLGESYYRISDRSTAEDYYNLFLSEPLAMQTGEYKKFNYSMGYLEFSGKNYTNAEKWFREYVNLERNQDAVSLADAYNRLGDCRFINSSYWQAIENYDKVISLAKADVDYAYYQKGFCLGLVDRAPRKIETLQELLVKYPKSAYVDDALYEIGRTYVILNQPEEARKSYSRIVTEHPTSNYLSKTLIQLGLYHKNEKNNTEALNYYKRVVNDFPGTPESSVALRTIKDIYVDMNRVDDYLAYVDGIGQETTASEQDSLIYVSAENTYLQGNCDRAITSLDNYISRFPDGTFLLNAHYYRADCLLKTGRGDEAFESLTYIISQPSGLFTEPALLAASRMAYSKQEYDRAADLYQKLANIGENKANIAEAQSGLMRSYAKLGEYQNTIEASKIVLMQDKLDEHLEKEAKYQIASSYLKQKDTPAAFDWFSQIANEVNTEMGAEAKYMLAEISYERGDVDLAEEHIFKFIDMNTPHQYWMGKSFLLLADIYVSKGDDFQAVQTLESIINYYTVETDGIKSEAVRKKEEITGRVDSDNQADEQEELEIEMN